MGKYVSGVKLTIFSGVGHFCRNFLIFIFKNVSCNNNLAGSGKFIFTYPMVHVKEFWGIGKVQFVKCEKNKQNYVPVTSLINVLFRNCKNFLEFYKTPISWKT